MVETNYRIYAYTDSDLHYAIISLFSEVLYRFPFMIVAQMSRDSVQRSVDYGITADQVLHYLRTSSHPTCRKNLHWVPQVCVNLTREITFLTKVNFFVKNKKKFFVKNNFFFVRNKTFFMKNKILCQKNFFVKNKTFFLKSKISLSKIYLFVRNTIFRKNMTIF